MSIRSNLTLAAMSAAVALTSGCQSLAGSACPEPSGGLHVVSSGGGEWLALIGLAMFVTVPLDLLILCATPNDPFPITRALFH